MKKIIIGLLTRGYTTTNKYTIDELVKAFYPLEHLIQQNVNMITANNNFFWNYRNLRNRCELVDDLKTAKLKNINSNLYHILNRYENGDGYGIKKEGDNI